MGHELKFFAIKLLGVLILMPFMGFIFLQLFERAEKAWKTNNRRKRWYVMCGVFFILACIGGWLQ